MDIKQPVLGILGTIICITVSILICIQFEIDVFNSWVSFIAIAAIPPQIILALVWDSQYPSLIAQLKQPLKGLAFCSLMLATGLASAYSFLYVFGNIGQPPSPIVIMYAIVCVLITMWLVVVWQCLPFSTVTTNKSLIGLGTLLTSYGIAYVIFWLGFNFDFMQAEPFYVKAYAPSGLFNAWTALTFILTSVAVIDAMILLDFWPINVLQKRYAILTKGILSPISLSIFILIVAYGIWFFFIKIINMDVVEYMVRVVVAFIFGEFIMLIMMQTEPFSKIRQPLKGLYLLLCCGCLAIILYALYEFLSFQLVGNMPSGQPSYTLELWLSSAMLSITFPLLIIYANFLDFWPFKDSKTK